MNKYSWHSGRNALLPIKFQVRPWAFVNYCHTNGSAVAGNGTWFQVYAETCIQMNNGCSDMAAGGAPEGLFVIQISTGGRQRRHLYRPSCAHRPIRLEKNGYDQSKLER